MSSRHRELPWKNNDFEKKFREAMGREMTRQEREFFGLVEESSETQSDGQEECQDSLPIHDPAQLEWRSLRRLTPLLG